jgi:hypothetical protein
MGDLAGSAIQSVGHNFVPFLVFTGIIFVVAIRTIGSVIKSNARERTRREIAAYIAEGTMTPEQGERLMRAGDAEDKGCC